MRFISENRRSQSVVEIGSTFNAFMKPQEAFLERKSTTLSNLDKPYFFINNYLRKYEKHLLLK